MPDFQRNQTGDKRLLAAVLLALTPVLPVLAAPLSPCAQISAAVAHPPPENYPVQRKAFDWQGDWRCLEVVFPSTRTGALLFGVLFAPSDAIARRLPGVVIAPGSGGGTQPHVQWSARDLAGHGYVTLTVDPQGVGRSETFGRSEPLVGVPSQQVGNYVDALESGLDFMLSADNPWRQRVDGTRVGLAGHSQSARAASYVQGRDPRVKAIVAWDNLARDLNGDAGSASGSRVASALIGLTLPFPRPAQPAVPAMGQANDNVGGLTPFNDDPKVKTTAYRFWHNAGQPSMELVFRGTKHVSWAQLDKQSSPHAEALLHRFEYYTRAWFDLYLKNDPTARRRLFAPTVLGEDRDDLLSTHFRSAAYLPSAGIDCPSLTSPGCATAPPP